MNERIVWNVWEVHIEAVHSSLRRRLSRSISRQPYLEEHVERSTEDFEVGLPSYVNSFQ